MHFSPTCDQSQQRNEHVATRVQEVEAHTSDRSQGLGMETEGHGKAAGGGGGAEERQGNVTST